MTSSNTLMDGFIPLDAKARNGAAFLVHNPGTGDYAKAWWVGDMWALYCGADYPTVMQLDFEPTHYKPLSLIRKES